MSAVSPNHGIDWRDIKKFICISGFILPPLIGFGEAFVVGGAFIHGKTAKANKIKAEILHLHIQAAAYAISTVLAQKMTTELPTIDINELKSKFVVLNEQLIKAQFRFKNPIAWFNKMILEATSYSGNLAVFNNFITVQDVFLFDPISIDKTIFQHNSEELENLLNRNVTEMNQLKDEISTIKIQIQSSKLISESEITRFNTRIINLQTRLGNITSSGNTLLASSQNNGKDEVKAELLPVDFSRYVDQVHFNLDRIEKQLDSIGQKLKQQRADILESNKESIAIIREDLNKQVADPARSLYKQTIKVLEIQLLAKEYEFYTVSAKAKSIYILLQYKNHMEEIKTRGLHSLASFTFIGSYIVGGYELRQIAKKEKAIAEQEKKRSPHVQSDNLLSLVFFDH